MGLGLGNQTELVGASVARVLALHLNPEQGTGAYHADRVPGRSLYAGPQSPPLEASGSYRFQCVGQQEEKYPTVPTAGIPHSPGKINPSPYPNCLGPYLGGRYGHHPVVKSQESRHSGKSPQY